VGIAALAVGVALLGLAYHASGAPLDQISNAVTGHYTNQTVWYLVSGIGVALGGGLLAMFGKRI
jgi:hypothetical protein